MEIPGKRILLCFAVLLSFGERNLFAQEIPSIGPDSLISYTATISNGSLKEIVLSYAALSLDSGFYTHRFLLPDGFLIDSSNTSIFSGMVHQIGDTMRSVAFIKMPQNGYYWSHLMVSYQPIVRDSINMNLALLRTNPLYYEVKDSSVDSVSFTPDSNFYPRLAVLDTAGLPSLGNLNIRSTNDGLLLTAFHETRLEIRIFDAVGHQIQFSKTLYLSEGQHAIKLGLPSGIWFAEIRWGSHVSIVKLISFNS